MPNRAPIARAGFSAGSASDYLRMVSNDAISIRSLRNGLTNYTNPKIVNLLRLFQSARAPQIISNWRSPNSPPSSSIRSIAYGNGVFVVASSVGPLWYSNDNCDTWSQADGTLFPGGNCYDVRFDVGVFIAVGTQVIDPGEYASVTANNYYSTDGRVWTPEFFETFSISHRVAYAQARWIVVNYFYGTLTQGGPSGLTDVVFVDDVGDPVRTYNIHPRMSQVAGIASDGTSTVVVGTQYDYQLPVLDGEGNVIDIQTFTGDKAIRMVTSDPSSAPGISFPGATYLTGVAYGNGNWVITGVHPTGSIMFYSTDTESWTQVVEDPFNEGHAYRVQFVNGVFYAVGAAGGKGAIATSTTGEIWTRLTDVPNVPNEFTDILIGVDAKLIVVGTDGVFLSKI